MTAPDPTQPRRGGRPSRADALRLNADILAVATALLLDQGYANTSMEAIAAAAGISKRTLYARFADKGAVLRAVVADLVANRLPPFTAALAAPDLRTALTAAAAHLLDAALHPTGLGLYRLLVAEAGRIPELPALLREAGADSGIAQLTARLAAAGLPDPAWRAEQFQRLVIAGPQARALGLAPPMTDVERAHHVAATIALVLGETPPPATEN